MNQMYMANRLFINFFQPSFKLLETQRIGGKTVRRHDAPKTPYNRLIELHTLRAELRGHFDDIIHALDPLKLLETIRLYQHVGTNSCRGSRRIQKQRFNRVFAGSLRSLAGGCGKSFTSSRTIKTPSLANPGRSLCGSLERNRILAES